MRTFHNKYKSNIKTKKGGTFSSSKIISKPRNVSSTLVLNKNEKLENIKDNIQNKSNDYIKTYKSSLDNNQNNTLENLEDISFLDILKKNNVSLFDASTPEIKLDDLGITVKPISKKAQELYYANTLFPLTTFYYENNKESRDLLGLNYSETKNVSVNKLLSTSNIFQCTDISLKNSNYTKENIKQQDNKEMVIGSNIFGETSQNINLNNTNSLFKKVVYENSKTDSSSRQDFVRQERLKKFGQTAGANIVSFKDLQDTTSLTDKLDGLYWFSTHKHNDIRRKVEQFINYYMFSQNYQSNNTTISQTNTKVDGNSSSNISIITDYQKTIMSLSTPTEIYSAMPGWVKARGLGLGSAFSFLSTISFGLVARNAVSDIGATETRSISYNDLNHTNPEAIGSRNYIVSIIDKKHLLYSIFLKIIVEIDDNNFQYLCSLLKIDEYYINMLDANRKEIKTRFNENIPYNLFMENLYLNKMNNEVNIQTVLNKIFDRDIFIYNNRLSDDDNNSSTEDCEPIWNDYLAKLYFYFINGTIEKYNVKKTYYKFKSQFTETSNVPPKICDIVIDNGFDNIMKYSYIDIAPPVTFKPEDYSENGRIFGASRESGYGNIKDGKGKMWFYDKETGVVTNENNTIKTNFNDIQTWQNVGSTGTVFSTVNSRITHPRSNLLCYLSELIYSPNDIVKKVSDDMFQASEPANIDKSRIIYIGGYDNDPSYPYAFDSADNNKLKPSYSRIHVWLYINNNYNFDTTPIDDIPSLELFIVNRGSKTGLDWEDIDKCISEGTALYNERPMSYSKILYNILNDLDSKYNDITPFMKPSSRRSGSQIQTYSRNLQIISSGHSLGGFLGLYFSFMSLSRNVIENFTSITGNIKGLRRYGQGNSPPQWKVNRYILPIVFQPYVKTELIIQTYNKIPCGVINTVYNFRKITTPKIYIDAASSDFFSYIETNKGDLKVCKYENVYLNNKISSMHTSLYTTGLFSRNRVSDITVNSHALWQMSGLCLKYYSEHVKTNFYIKANINGSLKNQNLEVTKYQFNFENDCNEYSENNTDGANFTKNQAINNIKSNIKQFLSAPDGKILPTINYSTGGKSFKKTLNRKSKRKTHKIRSRKYNIF
jgi:hypothetical protein